MAVPVNTIWYANSVGWTAVTAWATGTVKAAGALVRQNAAPTVGNERVFACVVAGTTHATTEPTWILTQGSKTTDNTITWMEVTGKPAVNGDVTNTPASSTARSQAAVLGNIIKNNAATHYFICTTAGTCGASEPTYGTTAGNTTTDNTTTWTCLGAVGSFTAWQAPNARMASVFVLAGDTVYISSIHAETQAAAWTLSPAGDASYVCVADAGSTPPTAADVTTGASVTTTGNNTIGFTTTFAIYGVAFICGTGLFATSINIGSPNTNSPDEKFVNCSFALRATASPAWNIGSSTSKVELVNTTFSFPNNTGSFSFNGGQVYWRDTPSAALSSIGTIPNNPMNAGGSGTILIENVDLSAYTPAAALFNINTMAQKIVFSRCTLPPSAPIITAGSAGRHGEIDLIDCDTGGATYRHERLWCREGFQTTETAVVKTGGASDGTTTYSWKIATGTSARWEHAFESMPITIWNSTTGSNVTATIEGILSAAALPNNDEIWLTASYFGTAASTLGSRVTQTKATPLTAATALTASTEAWDSLATARQNTHAYALGDIVKVATNSRRLFICTTAGTSAGSEPGGYASAVDGGSVSDNTAVFRAMMRFKLAVTMTGPTPQIAGYVYARVRVGKASTTYYIDPKVTLS